MKSNLSKETKLDAWDHIMMGAFSKVFKMHEKYKTQEVFEGMKHMNFDQVNQVK
jgi:hypothetical protein